MKKISIYTHNREDLKRIVRLVIDEIRNTEILPQSFKNIKNDRLTQKEAAQFLGISITSLISWKKQGKIPYYQIGRSIFYYKSELLKVAKKSRATL
ncbi:helix-turn-helix domain-containing protein [uncultured Aquimarina sp.]|uniref:helix-turn-helix domain-containing protein n=1 Tax=uncultured Aquimarina sp. TaxID=575652 RepID=UPI002638736D|nr:helix-turn-helix domain-containing protein [uncultured Aquimarina sp.]